MTLPTTSIRTQVKRRVVDLITAEGPTRLDGQPVQVLHARNDRLLENEVVYLDAVRGEQSIPVMGTPVQRNDVFTIGLWVVVRVEGIDSAYDADLHCEALTSAVQTVLRRTPGLGNTGAGSLMPGVLWSRIALADGPDFGPWVQMDGTQSGYASAMQLGLEVHTRLS